LTNIPEILRRFAETSMHALVRAVFSRLHDIDPIEEEARLKQAEADDQGEIRMTVSTNDVPQAGSRETAATQVNGDVPSEPLDPNAAAVAQQNDPPPSPGARTQCAMA